MSSVFGELAEALAGGAPQAGGAQPIATVTRVQDPDDSGRGTLVAATLGELPLDASDILFLRHTAGLVLPGERLLLLPADAEEQSYYCIGRV